MMNLEGLDGALYLRKSRKDIQAEREATAIGKPYDTLEKHRIELFRLVRDLKVNVVDVFEEIVSGEFIAERPEMQKLLENILSEKYDWVMVMDEDRFGRGDKVEQGRIERAFKQSGTLIVTPGKIVDMEDEADEFYMDFKGMGARYEYKQTKKRLQRGRRESAGRGNYIGAKTPFGYIKGIDLKLTFPDLVCNYADKPADIESLRLYPHPHNAGIVREAYQLAISGVGARTIAKLLTQMSTSPEGKKTWARNSVRRLMKNEIYLGKIIWGRRKFIKQETGGYLQKEAAPHQIEIVENAHEPLVSVETYELANKLISERFTPPVNVSKDLVNPLATLVYCSFCQLAVKFQPYHDGRRGRITCMNPHCKLNRSTVFELVEERVLDSIDRYYRTLVANPRHLKQKEANLLKIHKQEKMRLLGDIEDSRKQIDNMHDLLEKKIYSPETFLDRQNVVQAKVKGLQTELDKVERAIEGEEHRQHVVKDLTPRFKNLVDMYRAAATPKEKNMLLKSVIDQIIYHKPKTRPKSEDFELIITWLD